MQHALVNKISRKSKPTHERTASTSLLRAEKEKDHNAL